MNKISYARLELKSGEYNIPPAVEVPISTLHFLEKNIFLN